MSEATLEQMKTSLGSLLYVWAKIERAARHEIACVNGAPPKRAHGIRATLETWKDTLPHSATSLNPSLAAALFERLRREIEVRNGLCHGLAGISAADGIAPARYIWETDGDEFSTTYGELHAALEWLVQVPRAIAMLSRAPSDRLSDRSADYPHNRDWWRAEFGLEPWPA